MFDSKHEKWGFFAGCLVLAAFIGAGGWIATGSVTWMLSLLPAFGTAGCSCRA